MKKMYFTVGPSQLYPTAQKHIRRALKDEIYSLSHRSSQFSDINRKTQASLRRLLAIPTSHHLFFTSCALEGMERTIANTVEKKSFHFVNGSFSREFWQIAIDLGKQSMRFDVPNGEGFDFSQVKISQDVELICLVQNETSTGVAQPMESIYALKKRYPQTLLAIDMVSSAPFTDIDFSLIDIAFFSVQKGFGMPAGLGVLIVNDRALEKAAWLTKKGISLGSYHSFPKFDEFAKKFQTRETPNVGAIYLLGKVSEDMLARGIATIRQQTEKKAEMIYDFFDAHERYNPVVSQPFRSKTTMVIDVNGESAKIQEYLAEKGVIVSSGYGKRKEWHIRIGNFPAHSGADMKRLITILGDINVRE